MNGAKFPTVKLTGGALGISMTLLVDDVEQTGVTHVSVDADAKGVNEVVIERMGAELNIEVQARVRDRWDMTARLTGLTGHLPREFHGQGASLAEAIRDIAAMVGHAERNGELRG